MTGLLLQSRQRGFLETSVIVTEAKLADNHRQLGEGSIRPIQAIPPDLLDYKLIWSPPPSAYTNSTTNSAVNELMGRTLEGVYGEVVRVNNASEVEAQCRQSFNLRSNCFAAVVFGDIDTGSRTLVSCPDPDQALVRTADARIRITLSEATAV